MENGDEGNYVWDYGHKYKIEKLKKDLVDPEVIDRLMSFHIRKEGREISEIFCDEIVLVGDKYQFLLHWIPIYQVYKEDVDRIDVANMEVILK
ncbi:MAG: hypothetical protein LAN71_17170 [Acidobacteriia bacterium]|nr:hypothetical protein [Terriglobia bacterium]